MGLFGIGRKKQPVSRYAGKPFLLLVDSFILKCIGRLDPADELSLVEMTPKLQEVYASDGTWDEIVIAVLHFPPTIPESILRMWMKNQDIAQQHGVVLTPMQFVEMFVASNIDIP